MIRAYAFKRITVDSLCFDNVGSLCSDTERDDEGIRTKIMKWKVVNFKDIIGKWNMLNRGWGLEKSKW